MEFKKRYRPVRILLSTGTTIATRAVTVDDTKLVAEVIKDISEQIGNTGVITEDELFNMHEDECMLLMVSSFIDCFSLITTPTPTHHCYCFVTHHFKKKKKKKR